MIYRSQCPNAGCRKLLLCSTHLKHKQFYDSVICPKQHLHLWINYHAHHWAFDKNTLAITAYPRIATASSILWGTYLVQEKGHLPDDCTSILSDALPTMRRNSVTRPSSLTPASKLASGCQRDLGTASYTRCKEKYTQWWWGFQNCEHRISHIERKNTIATLIFINSDDGWPWIGMGKINVNITKDFISWNSGIQIEVYIYRINSPRKGTRS